MLLLRKKRASGKFPYSLAFKHSIIEAAFRTCVASRTFLLYINSKGVTVTVCNNLYDVLVVTACFTLEPKFLTATAPETGKLLFNGNFKAFLVHICKGKHLVCFCINYYCRNKSLFVKFKCIYIKHFYMIVII